MQLEATQRTVMRPHGRGTQRCVNSRAEFSMDAKGIDRMDKSSLDVFQTSRELELKELTRAD
ncbi:hypothetical protein AFA91_23020 [Mycolicibacterium goodii]|uniref:Uncharacterized protein n=1 Tax=Mycolicibacterium goodii TaxID=134601 RepID=A0A0K0XA71_MYCGD|nr:hypothetical protein AFA91_23020 [Mycolicibacterium goodii]